MYGLCTSNDNRGNMFTLGPTVPTATGEKVVGLAERAISISCIVGRTVPGDGILLQLALRKVSITVTSHV